MLARSPALTGPPSPPKKTTCLFAAARRVDAPAPAGPEYVAGCPVCAYWFAQGDWSAAHPDAPLDIDFDAPDDPWHLVLI